MISAGFETTDPMTQTRTAARYRAGYHRNLRR